jgi:hypothetical protein
MTVRLARAIATEQALYAGADISPNSLAEMTAALVGMTGGTVRPSLSVVREVEGE